MFELTPWDNPSSHITSSLVRFQVGIYIRQTLALSAGSPISNSPAECAISGLSDWLIAMGDAISLFGRDYSVRHRHRGIIEETTKTPFQVHPVLTRPSIMGNIS